MGQMVLDYLLVILAIAVSWSYGSGPPPQDRSTGTTALRSTSHAAIDDAPALTSAMGSVGPLADTLEKICVACGYRSIDTFVNGACESYETITNAFADGEIEAQASLLSDPVRLAFAAAIKARRERGEDCELTFIGFQSVDVINAELANGVAQITVHFRSQIVSATRDTLGKVVTGDPHRSVETSDLWTFERDLSSRAPQWILVGSDATD